MGEKNDALCAFLEKPKIFADFVDGSLYDGEKVVEPGELSEVRKEYHVKTEDRSGRLQRVNRARDVVKKLCRGEKYAILAVENQDELHYCMPLRCMEYDVADYIKQLRILKKQHSEAKDLKKGAEYLTGIKKEDRLNPVVTIVFYHGKGSWDASSDLHGE